MIFLSILPSAYTATASCVQIFYLPSLCCLAKPNLLTVLMKLIFDQCQKFFVANIQSLTSMVYLGWVETLPGPIGSSRHHNETYTMDLLGLMWTGKDKLERSNNIARRN